MGEEPIGHVRWPGPPRPADITQERRAVYRFVAAEKSILVVIVKAASADGAWFGSGLPVVGSGAPVVGRDDLMRAEACASVVGGRATRGFGPTYRPRHRTTDPQRGGELLRSRRSVKRLSSPPPRTRGFERRRTLGFVLLSFCEPDHVLWTESGHDYDPRSEAFALAGTPDQYMPDPSPTSRCSRDARDHLDVAGGRCDGRPAAITLPVDAASL
jgi:hypothetical protein